MMTFLVVDDDEIIRQTLTAMINNYCSAKNVPHTILEAQDGSYAIQIAKKQWCDVIFMDINMPNINGIDATKIIKDFSLGSMIIAISSEDDTQQRDELLKIGAEDYIVKPLTTNSFSSRLANYLSVLKHRNSIGYQSSVTNVFTTKVYSYTMNFSISNEEELAQFWEAILIRFEMQKIVVNLNDIIRVIFRIGSLMLGYRYKSSIIIEEDRTNFYFSMTNIGLLDNMNIDELIQKSISDARFAIKEGVLSFVLVKDEPTGQTPVKKAELKESNKEATVSTINSATEHVEETLTVYDFLDEDDLDDVEEKLYQLQTINMSMSTHALSNLDASNICNYFDGIASCISASTKTYTLSEGLHRLSSTIRANQDVFIEKGEELSAFGTAFVSDLMVWKEMVFYTGAPSIGFMDDSIMANIEMIISVIIPPVVDSDNLDDIFAF